MRPEYTINPERRALYRRQGFWGDATLADYWHQSVRAVPDRTCVVDSQGGRYTYAQLDKKAQRLAGWMRTIGVGRGDVVALNLPGWAEFTIAYVAALKLGAIAMPLLPAWREAELSWALDWCEAKVVFTATAFRKSRPIEKLAADGVLITGDAAALCINLGFIVRGMDLAVASGECAARAVIDAKKAGDFSAAGLAGYRRRLEESFVLRDMKQYRNVPHLMENPRLFSDYPKMTAGIMRDLFRYDGSPVPPVRKSLWQRVKAAGVMNLLKDGYGWGKAL